MFPALDVRVPCHGSSSAGDARAANVRRGCFRADLAPITPRERIVHSGGTTVVRRAACRARACQTEHVAGSGAGERGNGGMRRAKIVATLGPATTDDETVEALVRAGVDIARINFGHGDYD